VNTPPPIDFRTRFRAVLESYLANPALTVDLLADELELSRRHLLRRCDDAFGISPSQLIRMTRLERAHALLGSGRCPSVAHAAHSVGMAPAYFSRSYSARFGQTARETLLNARRVAKNDSDGTNR